MRLSPSDASSLRRALVAARGVFLGAALAAPVLAQTPLGIEGGLSRLYQQVTPSVVKVVSHRACPTVADRGAPCRQLVASGVVIGENGSIVTTDRVAQPGDSLIVIFADGRQTAAVYLGAHSYLHLAVLRLRAPGPFPSLPHAAPGARLPDWVATVAYGPWDGPRPGLPVLSLAQRGSIEPMRVRCGDSLGTVWRVRSPFYPGNGGGALVTLSGEWMGLITGAVAVEGAFAGPPRSGERLSWEEGVIVPADLVNRAVREIESGPRSDTQGFLGVLATRRAGASEGGVPADGVRVSGVLEGSPAERGGILVGDLLTRFDGYPVAEAEQLTHLVSATPPGKTVQVEILRRGAHRSIEIHLGNRASGEARVAWQRDQAAGQAGLRHEISELQMRLRHLQQQLDASQTNAATVRPDPTTPRSD
jgi:serine protease Do